MAFKSLGRWEGLMIFCSLRLQIWLGFQVAVVDSEIIPSDRRASVDSESVGFSGASADRWMNKRSIKSI